MFKVQRWLRIAKNDEIYFPKYFCFKFIDDQVLVPPSEGVDVSVDVGASPVHVGNHVKSM